MLTERLSKVAIQIRKREFHEIQVMYRKEQVRLTKIKKQSVKFRGVFFTWKLVFTA